MSALLVLRRREASIRLLRSRGASAGQLLAAQAVETTVLVLPAAALATVVAVALVPGPDIADAALRAALVGAVAVGLVLAATWPLTHGRIDGGELAAGRAADRRGRGWLRRLVLDGTVIALAAIALVTLRSRGLGDGSGPVAIDPLLAAVPVLVALAAGLILLRVYPLPLRLIAAIAARGRGLIPTFPLWGAARQSRIAAVPLLVILVATAIGAFSSVVLESVRQGQLAASWRAVGADWRIDADPGIPVPSALDLRAVPGVGAVAGLTDGRRHRAQRHRAPPADDGRRAGPERARRGDRRDGLPVRRPAPAGPRDVGPLDRHGSRPDPGRRLDRPRRACPPRRHEPDLRARRRHRDRRWRSWPSPTCCPATRRPRPSWSRRSGPCRRSIRGSASTRRAISSPGTPPSATRSAAAIAPYGDLLHLRSRDAVYRALHETPLIAIVEGGMGLALLIGVGYAGLALLAGLTIALAIRRRDLHVLRTLGLSRGGISSTIVIEQVPLLLVALIGGGLVGVGLALAIGPSVGLAAFTDGLPTIPMVVDPLATLSVGILPMAAGIVAAVLSGWFLRRSDLARAVRFNEG